MSIEHFSNFVREEYKPCDLSLAKDNIPVFTQSYVIGWKKKDGIGDIFMLTKSRKCRWEEGILLASLLPIDANCSLTMLEICEESLISLFLLFGFLIVVKVLSFFFYGETIPH